ncbi:MAG: aminotransferase class I/II-fold pyridoxal phosphate-dependent enzyme [Anaerolineales bacterium]|nr:aminotransferase class I/II-fold pyridoxal phosphate-dependent enzyme [Anaerolineales bacterium]
MLAQKIALTEACRNNNPRPARFAGPSTQSVHGDRSPNPYHAVGEPIVRTATYQFKDTADLCTLMEANLWGRNDGRTEYGRYGNPTVAAVEKRLAGLDNAEDAILFSSGMAAITTVLLAMLSSGAHVIITDDSYRRTRQFCHTFLKRLGIETTVVPMGDYETLETAIQPNTRLLISESPTNPYLRTLDIERFVAIAKKHQVKTFVDATFATPLNIRPLDWGVDLVIHSATKYLAGHNDLLAGVVVGESGLLQGLRGALGVLGAIAAPDTASLLLRGIKTLGLRIERQNQNGLAVSQFLESHPKVERVWYPGLESHPDHQIAQRQMSGFGGVVSFTVKGDLERTSRLVDAVGIPLIAASLGGVESLIEQPALMSFYELSTQERLEVGITNNLVRLSLGIEDTADLIADLDQALAQI